MPVQPIDALRAIAELRGDAIAVPTMTTVQSWHQLSPSELNVTCTGFMGGASALGLGLALARPERRVIVLDGDGSLLMQLGSLATIAGAAPPNYYHFVFKNGVYHVSGKQSIPAADRVDFAAMAAAAGYAKSFSFEDLEDFRVQLPAVFAAPGPVLVELTTELVPNAPLGGVRGGNFPEQAQTAHRALTGAAD